MLQKFKLAAMSSALLLVACGGGGSESTTANAKITGLAATGAAFSNANLTAKCATGSPVTGNTDRDGIFSLELSGGQTLPCLVQASNEVLTLHSFATEAGRINITPLTDLVLSRALGSDIASAFAQFDASKAAAIQAKLVAAKTYMKDEVAAITGTAPLGDLMTGLFAVGDADDKVLDKLTATLAANGKKLDDLRLGAHSGSSLQAALGRGTLSGGDSVVTVTTLTTAQINTAATASGLQALSGVAKCDVKVVALKYNTVGVKGEKATASGVMLVPTGAGTCSTVASGLVAYAKGTDVEKPRTLANPADPETFLLVAMYAAQGYTVVATDYLGFARSDYSYHPYLHADSEATSVIDSIRAARRASTNVGALLSGKVMLAGYSQGGHSSMAAHRAIERDNTKEISVIAGAHMAGPYNLQGSLRSPTVIAGFQFFATYLVTAWQKVYGTIYSDIKTVFKKPYSDYAENLLPSPTLTYTTLITTGKLPGARGETPAQIKDALVQTAFFNDVQTNDQNSLYLAAKKNSLLGWNPKSKLMLCGGAGDPTVPQALHQTVMKADFDSRKLTNVTSVDVDASVQAAYGPNGKAPTDPSSAEFATYYGNYHDAYETPLCLAQSKLFFDSVK